MIIPALSLAFLIQSTIEPKIEAKVNPGMEVIAITMWLAGQYPAPTDSPYKLEVWNHFRKFKSHPAVTALKKAKGMYTDFTASGQLMVGWPKAHYQNSLRNDEGKRILTTTSESFPTSSRRQSSGHFSRVTGLSMPGTQGNSLSWPSNERWFQVWKSSIDMEARVHDPSSKYSLSH